MSQPYKLPVINVKGLAIIETPGLHIEADIQDEDDDIVKFTLLFFPNFDDFRKEYSDHNGRFRMEVVKRRKPSPHGHNYFARVGSTSICKTDGIIPRKPNELT